MENQSTSHTSGPWDPATSADGEIVIFGQDSDWYVCALNPDDERMHANARLIAAAPELLEHMRNIVEMARSVAANWESGDLAHAVRSLERIATAEVAIANSA